MLMLAWLSTARAVTFDALIADPVPVLLADADTAGGFRMIALSNAAEACAGRAMTGVWTQEQAHACLRNLVEGALDPRISPWGKPVSEVEDFGRNGLFLSHLAIVLGSADAIDPDLCDPVLHERIAAHLERLALAGKAGVGPSYPSATERWPADQAATLYALELHRRAHGADHLSAPLDRYLASIPEHGLPASELTGRHPTSALPRGCALAFTVRYLAPVAPDTAWGLWRRAIDAGFVDEIGPLVAMREWPPGVDRPGDIDSGPIVGGYGASATAFGQSAAAAVHDDRMADGFARTATLGYRLAGRAFDADAADSALAAAIRAQAELRWGVEE